MACSCVLQFVMILDCLPDSELELGKDFADVIDRTGVVVMKNTHGNIFFLELPLLFSFYILHGLSFLLIFCSVVLSFHFFLLPIVTKPNFFCFCFFFLVFLHQNLEIG